MASKEDLTAWVRDVFRSEWTTRESTSVPTDGTQLGLKNDAITINGTVLYADLADSTKMVDRETATFAAEVYKTFLYCAAQVIRDSGGIITAYDGDRVMAVFVGDTKNSNAVKAALKIKWAVDYIVEAELRRFYTHRPDYVVPHVVGIDTTELLVAKTGVWGANDLVWVGRSANYAARLSSLPPSYTYITKGVYDALNAQSKLSGGTNMWTPIPWPEFDNLIIYRSSYRWAMA